MSSTSPNPLFAALQNVSAQGLEANARRWLAFAGWRSGDYVEIQALGFTGRMQGWTIAAHAPDPDAYVRLLAQIENNADKPQAIYTIANSVPHAAATRQGMPGEWHRLLKDGNSTTDKDISNRAVLYVDIDVERARNTSASDEEVTKVCEVAQRIYVDLGTAIGNYDAVALGLSGNGCAIFVALDYLTETPEVRRCVNECVASIKAIYETNIVRIDSQVTDPKRLVPAFGTTKRKGPVDPTRPHRRTALLTPDKVHRLSAFELERLRANLVAKAPPPPARPAPTVVFPQLDLDAPESENKDENDLSIGSLRRKLAGLRKRKQSSQAPEHVEHFRILTAILEGTPLAFAHGNGGPPRAATVNRAAALLAFGLPVGTPWEIVLEVMRPALAAMDTEPEGLGHWIEMAEESYGRAMTRAIDHAKQNATFRENERLAQEALLAAAPEKPEDAAFSGTETASTSSNLKPNTPGYLATLTAIGTQTQTDNWMDLLVRGADKKIQDCAYNVYLILTHHPVFKGTIRFNRVTKDIEVVDGPFKGVEAEVLSTQITDWLQKVVRIKAKKNEVEDRILVVAYENSYDPIADYLNGLVWDGVPRLEKFFSHHVKARTVNDAGDDITQHLQRIAPKFFISAVARALDPGCQVDTVLVLEGKKEGEGKSSLFRELFAPYYIELSINAEHKDAQMVGGANWCIVFDEMKSFRRADDDYIKGFLTRRDDKYRPPYGKRYVTEKRRCIAVGTTNDEKWLTVGKGRRRYWPVYVNSIDLDAVRMDRDQLFAEAVERYRKGERWHLDAEERREADAEAENRIDSSFVEQKIAAWWFGLPMSRRPGQVSLVYLVENVLNTQAGQAVSRGLQTEIGIAMDRLGFEKSRPTVGNRRVYVWVPTEELMQAPETPHTRFATGNEAAAQAMASLKPGGAG